MNRDIFKFIIRRNLTELQNSLSATVIKNLDKIIYAGELIAGTFLMGGKILICGNGGSAADAQHFAAEFVSSFRNGLDRKALPALALTTDSSILTAYSNDFDFRDVFVRQVEAYGNPSDILIIFSTSGTSENCLRALARAKEIGLKTVSFTKANSKCGSISDISLEVETSDTQRIQENHVYLYHTICEIVENIVLDNKHERQK